LGSALMNALAAHSNTIASNSPTSFLGPRILI
jgi:hypothetical protein